MLMSHLIFFRRNDVSLNAASSVMSWPLVSWSMKVSNHEPRRTHGFGCRGGVGAKKSNLLLILIYTKMNGKQTKAFKRENRFICRRDKNCISDLNFLRPVGWGKSNHYNVLQNCAILITIQNTTSTVDKFSYRNRLKRISSLFLFVILQTSKNLISNLWVQLSHTVRTIYLPQ